MLHLEYFSMIELLREPDSVNIGYLQGILESEGIPTFVRNDNLSRVEVPIPAFWPALCVVNDQDFQRAETIWNQIKEERQNVAVANKVEWTCSGCGESNPANFDICWSCQKPAETS